MGEQGGWNTGEYMGAREVREAGEKRVRRKKNTGKLFSNAYYLAMEKELKGGSQEKGGLLKKRF